jgi:hypothetical protein
VNLCSLFILRLLPLSFCLLSVTNPPKFAHSGIRGLQGVDGQDEEIIHDVLPGTSPILEGAAYFIRGVAFQNSSPLASWPLHEPPYPLHAHADPPHPNHHTPPLPLRHPTMHCNRLLHASPRSPGGGDTLNLPELNLRNFIHTRPMSTHTDLKGVTECSRRG